MHPISKYVHIHSKAMHYLLTGMSHLSQWNFCFTCSTDAIFAQVSTFFAISQCARVFTRPTQLYLTSKVISVPSFLDVFFVSLHSW